MKKRIKNWISRHDVLCIISGIIILPMASLAVALYVSGPLGMAIGTIMPATAVFWYYD